MAQIIRAPTRRGGIPLQAAIKHRKGMIVCKVQYCLPGTPGNMCLAGPHFRAESKWA